MNINRLKDMDYQNKYEQLIRWGQQILNDNDADAAQNWLRRFGEYAVDIKNGNINPNIVRFLSNLRVNIYNLSKFGICRRNRMVDMRNGNNDYAMEESERKGAVKLNESQLRKIVAESMKNILSEIDWKTYRNAQEKNREREPEYEENYWKLQDAIEAAHKRGDDKEVQKLQRKQDKMINKSLRTSKFGSASNDAFNDKFFANSHDRFDKQNGKSFAPFKNTDDGSYSTPEPWMDDNGNIHNGRYFDGHGKTDGKYFDDTIEYSKLGKGGYGNVTYDGEMNGDDNTAYSDEELNSLGIPDNEINDIEKARREIRRYRNGDYAYDNEKGWRLKESIEKAVNTVLKEYFSKKK